jgi:hypothetical protein
VILISDIVLPLIIASAEAPYPTPASSVILIIGADVYVPPETTGIEATLVTSYSKTPVALSTPHVPVDFSGIL